MIQAPERPKVAVAEEAPAVPGIEEQLEPVRNFREILTNAVGVFLSVSAAGWMSGAIFKGGLARVVALGGALLGTGVIAASYRTRRPLIVQYLALPAAVILGALLVAPDTGGGATVVSLVSEAIRFGGIAQPPIPFDPGWRFILLVLMTVLGSACASVALSLNRPRLGMFMPVPLLFGAALIQPKESSLATTIVSLLLLIASLAVSYGVELTREGASSGSFEIRRYARGAIVVVAIGVGLALLSRMGFLFTEQTSEQVIPPRKPEVQPAPVDRVLFSVRSDRPGPWRFGVLDSYADNGWLLPPFSSERLVPVPASGAIPPYEGAPAAKEGEVSATFVIADVEGHLIPTVAGTSTVSRKGFELEFDPRTQTLRLPEGRARSGMTYTVAAPTPPSGADLAAAQPPSESLKPYLDAPIQPNEVVTMLAEAPATNNWDRLQYVRNLFYANVVAAGAGSPVDVPPSRVVDMLAGKEATPYEITAAEALLARWAGVPARIGYGFYKGDKEEGEEEWRVHPRHGSTWLETYWEGYGWVPVVGTPPQAKASISEAERNEDPAVRPSDELALSVYVPVKLQSIRLLYTSVRYWVLVALPFVIAALLLGTFYPAAVKVARRRKRKRWSDKRGPRERIAAAYAELRDVSSDLNIGDPTATPLGFLDSINEDAEHRELAWLVTRALWGDLRRDLRDEDARAAEDLARSVLRRLIRAQPFAARIIAVSSRTSLRTPFSAEVPNLWPSWAERGAIRKAIRRRLRAVRRAIPIGSMLAVLLITAVACQRSEDHASGPRTLPKTLAPAEFRGFVFQSEPSAEESFDKVSKRDSLVTGGRVFTIRKSDEVLGSLQAAVFKPGFGATRREVREGVLSSIGSGRFELTRIGGERIYVKKLPEQTLYLWFARNGAFFELVVARQGFDEAGRLFAQLLAFQRGDEAAVIEGAVEVADPRRGENG